MRATLARSLPRLDREELRTGSCGAPDRPRPTLDRELHELECLLRLAVQLELLDRLEVVHQRA